MFLMLTVINTVMMGSVGALVYLQSRQAIIREAFTHMLGIANSRSAQIEIWFRDKKQDITVLSQLPRVVHLSRKLSSPGARNLSDSLELADMLESVYQTYGTFGPCGIFDTAGNPLARNSICRAKREDMINMPEFNAALRSSQAVLGKIQYLSPDTAVMRLAKAITDQSGNPVAVMVFTILPRNTLTSLLMDTTGLGETGETYLVGPDSILITPLRESASHLPLKAKVVTEGVERCRSQGIFLGRYAGYAGDEVLGAGIWMPGQNWALLAEMKAGEAMKPSVKIAAQILALMGVGALLVLAASALAARGLTRPLYRLSAASDAVARGDLEVRVEPSASDEIGSLTKQFNLMVTALRRSRQQLEASTRELLNAETLAAVGRLVASIVHEMRNPLSAVKMNLRILQKRVELDQTTTEHLNLAREETLRLERMLNELLEYSKPVKPEFRQVNLTRVLDDTCREMKETFSEREVEIDTAFPPEPVTLTSDQDLLKRIFDNLISNAIYASETGGEVTVKLEGGSRVEAVVTDRGRGMSEKVKQRLFETFFTTREDGIGLGMNNVKKFTEALHGTIEVESDEGVGTRITLSFPRSIGLSDEP